MASSGDDDNCSVCLTEAQDPRQVPCGNSHVFCLSCLQGLVTHGRSVQDSSFPCPCCRNRVAIPPGGVAAFPSVGEAGASNSARPAPERRPKAPFSPRQFFWGNKLRQNTRPRSTQRATEGGGGFRGNQIVGFPHVAGPPFAGPPRPMNHPFYAAAHPHPHFDLETDAPRYDHQGEDRPGQFPQLGYDRFHRLPEQFLPFVVHPAYSAPRPSQSPTARDPSRRSPRRAMAQAGWGVSRGLFMGHEGPPGGLASSSDDLDMNEVMLVIAQMEEDEQLVRAEREQDQDVLLRVQNEINEEEDFMEAICKP